MASIVERPDSRSLVRRPGADGRTLLFTIYGTADEEEAERTLQDNLSGFYRNVTWTINPTFVWLIAGGGTFTVNVTNLNLSSTVIVINAPTINLSATAVNITANTNWLVAVGITLRLCGPGALELCTQGGLTIGGPSSPVTMPGYIDFPSGSTPAFSTSPITIPGKLEGGSGVGELTPTAVAVDE